MKKSGILLLAIAIVLSVETYSFAQAQTYAIGADIALKVDYLHFFDSSIKDAKADNGVFVGVEFYKQLLFPNFYLGVETGWGGTNGTVSGAFAGYSASVDTEIAYVPIELNARYVIPVSQCLNFAIGGGISANWMYTDLTGNVLGVRSSINDSEWLFGGQFFGELNYRPSKCWELGLDVKYQITTEEDFTYTFSGSTIGTLPLSGDNLRAGGHIRYLF